jgi:hypothetical protein
MSTETLTRTVTPDTAEAVSAPVLPADDGSGDGYDWMDTLEGTAWSVLPNWGSDGWDAGSWPYIIFTVAARGTVTGSCSATAPMSKVTPPPTGSGPRRPALKRSPPRCFSTGPPASPTARTTSPPRPRNCPTRTGSPTRAGGRRTSLLPRPPTGRGTPGGTPTFVDNIIEIPSDHTCPLRPPPAPPFLRGLRPAAAQLRRSCVAYFLPQIARPWPFGWTGPPSGTAPQASPAAKKQPGAPMFFVNPRAIDCVNSLRAVNTPVTRAGAGGQAGR